MGKMINDIMNELDVRPGMADWEIAVRRYAMDLFKECMEQNGLNQWNEASRLGTITEKDLLNGAKDWDQYSRSSSLIYSMDIRMRLHIDDQEDLFDIQTKALEEAAYLVVAAISRLTGHGYHEFHETAELHKHLKYWSNSCGDLHHCGEYDLESVSDLPKELQRAYNELWKAGYGCYEYLAEYDGQYYIALISEFDSTFASDIGMSMDGLYEAAKGNALWLACKRLFKDTVLVIGKETGFEDCHEVIFLVPAMEQADVYDAIESVISKNITKGMA